MYVYLQGNGGSRRCDNIDGRQYAPVIIFFKVVLKQTHHNRAVLSTHHSPRPLQNLHRHFQRDCSLFSVWIARGRQGAGVDIGGYLGVQLAPTLWQQTLLLFGTTPSSGSACAQHAHTSVHAQKKSRYSTQQE